MGRDFVKKARRDAYAEVRSWLWTRSRRLSDPAERALLQETARAMEIEFRSGLDPVDPLTADPETVDPELLDLDATDLDAANGDMVGSDAPDRDVPDPNAADTDLMNSASDRGDSMVSEHRRRSPSDPVKDQKP